MASQYQKGLDASVEVLRTLAERLDETMPLRTALVFVKIAQRIGQNPNDLPDVTSIAEELDIPHPILSRDVGILSKFSRSAKGGGLEVVESLMDLRDRRRRRLKLTSKGSKIAEEIARRIRGGSNEGLAAHSAYSEPVRTDNSIIETVGPFETRAACERAVEQLADVARRPIHISAAACVSQSESESE